MRRDPAPYLISPWVAVAGCILVLICMAALAAQGALAQ